MKFIQPNQYPKCAATGKKCVHCSGSRPCEYRIEKEKQAKDGHE